jgi:hypothetical protein
LVTFEDVSTDQSLLVGAARRIATGESIQRAASFGPLRRKLRIVARRTTSLQLMPSAAACRSMAARKSGLQRKAITEMSI